MPVVLDHITRPSELDWEDLASIRNDTGLGDSALGFTSQRSELESELNDHNWIIGARLNDRLVGAMLATIRDDALELSQIGVRTITQQKGVLHQVLFLLGRWAEEHQVSLFVQGDKTPEDLKKSLARRGVAVR